MYDLVPGPGAYNTDRSTEGPQYGFGSKRKDTINSVAPGPGAYEARPTNEGRGPIMKSRRYIPMDQSSIPGPGKYDVEPTFGSGSVTDRSGISSPANLKYLPKNV